MGSNGEWSFVSLSFREGENQMSTTTEQLSKHVAEVAKDVQKMGSAVKETVQEKVDHVRESASQYYEQGRGKAHDAVCHAEKCISDRPLRSVLVAAGVGLLLGVIWMRR
jgi:ElaB/YqjD/DUF883 family membrane-anchored ribosome-binding protein